MDDTGYGANLMTSNYNYIALDDLQAIRNNAVSIHEV